MLAVALMAIRFGYDSSPIWVGYGAKTVLGLLTLVVTIAAVLALGAMLFGRHAKSRRALKILGAVTALPLLAMAFYAGGHGVTYTCPPENYVPDSPEARAVRVYLKFLRDDGVDVESVAKSSSPHASAPDPYTNYWFVSFERKRCNLFGQIVGYTNPTVPFVTLEPGTLKIQSVERYHHGQRLDGWRRAGAKTAR